MIEKIKKLIEMYENEITEIDEMYGDDFNACDASGGNFDDAYQLGFEHGEVHGKLVVLKELLKD